MLLVFPPTLRPRFAPGSSAAVPVRPSSPSPTLFVSPRADRLAFRGEGRARRTATPSSPPLNSAETNGRLVPRTESRLSRPRPQAARPLIRRADCSVGCFRCFLQRNNSGRNQDLAEILGRGSREKQTNSESARCSLAVCLLLNKEKSMWSSYSTENLLPTFNPTLQLYRNASRLSIREYLTAREVARHREL